VIDLDLSSGAGGTRLAVSEASNGNAQDKETPGARPDCGEDQQPEMVASEATRRRRHEIERALDRVDTSRSNGAASSVKPFQGKIYQRNRSAIVIDDDDEPSSHP
jgi:hypothetical protein